MLSGIILYIIINILVVAQIKSTDFSGIDAILSVSPAYNQWPSWW